MEIWYFLVILSSVLMGLSTIVEKVTLKREHATQFSAALTPLVTLLSLAFIPFANFSISAEQLLVLVVLSAFNAYGFLLTARVFKHGELSIASPVISSLPTLLVVVFAFLFLSETLSIWQYAIVAGMVITVYVLLFTKGRQVAMSGPEGKKYTYVLLFYCVLSAATTIVSKYLLITMNPFTFLILGGVFQSVFFTLMISLRYGGIREILGSVKAYKLPLAANALLVTGYRVTYFVALTLAPVSLAQPLRNTVYVVITVAFSGLLFKEQHIAKKLALGMVLLLLVYLLVANPLS